MATRLKSAAEATVALGLTAGAGFLGMRLFLGSPLNPQDSTPVIGPVPVPPEIAAIADDYQADLQYALHCVEQRWSYLEMRTAEHGGDLMGSLRSIALHHRSLPHPYYEDGEWPTFEYPLVEGEDYRALFEVYFRLNLENLADALRDGHAGVVFPKFRQRAPLRLPFSLVEVREGFMVTGVVEDTVQVQVGDLLLDALEPPTESSFRGVSSLAASRWQYVRDWPRATWQDEVELRFERPGVGEYRALLETVPVWTRVPGERLAKAERRHALLDGDIGYFRPGNFSPPPDSGWSDAPPEDRDGILAETYADFDRRLGELSGARALVLDLRGNPGGTDLLGQFLVDRLIDGDDYVYFQLSSLRKSGWSEFHELGSSAPPGETELHVPLAVLIDERTFSTADNVVACLADVHPDVLFVGQPNGAGSGAPRGFELPRTGATLYFCTQRVADPNGDLIEGHAQIPDIAVRPTRAQWLAGEDSALDAAVEALLGKL
ncbi:MAG: S41 family peptidase [Planctomycetota bacterium]